MTDTDREAFEAWASDGYQWPLSIEPSGDNYKHMHTAIKWAAWQAATQRQQSRIAYVEKVADDAIELGNQQAKRIAELEAEVQALRKDAERLDHLQKSGSTVELMPGAKDFYPMHFRVGGLHHAVSPNIRDAIDAAAAIEAERGEG